MKRTLFQARLAWLWAIAVGAALTPLAGRAVDGSEEVSGGGVIEYTGAAKVEWVTNADNTKDLLITYTAENAETDPSPASFTFPGMTQARILAIGGGGGGAGSYSLGYSGNYGGGGGGGAGGFVETNDMFSAETYKVLVGVGGAGGPRSASHKEAAIGYFGGNGEDTKITKGDDDAILVFASGGGGGAGEANGLDGASGGGSSVYRTTSSGEARQGGQGMPDQGNKGGDGDVALWGGGGGGAGAPGASASAGGKGGDGKSSDITGSEVWYAGGGGGSHTDKSITTETPGIPGGKGGGGTGGVGKGACASTPGEPGTGGGGGAGNASTEGSAGGSGIVIVRISGAITGGLEKPKDVMFAYDGKEHVSYQTSPFYTVMGQNKGTAVGVYVATVTPTSGITWTDGTSDAVTVSMTIFDSASLSGTVDVTGAPIRFVGAAATNWVANELGGHDLLIKYTGAGSFTLPGTTKARILAVGGGGGGAGSYSLGYSGNYGGGGGGGAGGFIETNTVFSAGDFKVNVGLGGAGGPRSASHKEAAIGYFGKNGGDSFILKGGNVPFLTAFGGGGGAGEANGLDGASGGGSSVYRTTSSGEARQGGQGMPDQGNKGGDGDVALWGGGGGGAGAPGASASAGGKGGDGKSSDITGSEVWYAGGGGGSHTDKSITTETPGIPGGKGGGGTGGVGKGACASTPGEPGTGGGGGAGNASTEGSAGGSGIIIVRISAAMIGELTKPDKIQTFTYDANAHTSVIASAFYDIEGDPIGTEVGEYKATVTLKNGTSWPGGDTESPLAITMTIKPVEVEFSGFSMASWDYTIYSAERPDPVCTVSPDWVKPVFEYATAKDAPEEAWGKKPSDVGDYWVRARVPDTKNHTGTTIFANFKISQRKVTFTDLFQKDWMEGTPDEAIPRPRCTIDPAWVTPTYEYGAEGADPLDNTAWKAEKPTELGTWSIRVRGPDLKNYAYTPVATAFQIVKGRGGTFVDYVEIEIAAYKGSNPSVLTNFPYKITLSEEEPYGFLYSRAGEDGNEMGLTDAKGNDLLYRVDDWNIHGESAIYVRIPEIGPEKQIIRLYWMLRPGATAPAHDPENVFDTWSKQKAAAITPPKMTYDLVVRDGYRVNYWKRDAVPRLVPTVWALGQTAGRLYSGKLMEGKYAEQVIDTLTGEPVTFPPTKGGSYRYVFTLIDPNMEYEPFEYHIDFAVTTTSPMDDLKGEVGDLTVNGRVMIANDDAAFGHEVTGQSYWRTDPETQRVFWEHNGEHTAVNTMPNLRRFAGSSHRLNYLREDGTTNLLWRMENVILGNTFRNTPLEETKCFLPWSPTGLAISADDPKLTGARDEAGCMVLRNTVGAAVYSPCYEDGIGTIYFDAVNAFAISSTYKPQYYAITVEIATNVLDDAGQSLPPTDVNCFGKNEFGNEVEFGRLREERWQTVQMIPLKRDNNATAFTRLEPTTVQTMDIVKGGSTNNFYRMCVNLDFRGPVRFRIRRVSDTGGNIDLNGGFISLDNIIVSYPKTTANLRPFGRYDAEKGGKRVIGQEGAFSVPFMAVNEGPVYAGATNDIYMSPAAKVDPKSLVLLSRMHYRWRYGNQASNDWQTVDLSPFDDYLSTTAIQLPYDEGDLEFFYESFMNVPYYRYYDYSGANIGLDGLYTEETGTITNRLDKSKYSNFTGPGDDWFVRFRAGKSDWDEFSVFVTGACYSVNQPMELIGDHVWRGLVKVPTNASGTVGFRFIGNCRRGPYGRLVESDVWWYPTADVEKMPGRGETTTLRSEHVYYADGASNYIEFQFNDETHAFTIGHAEYQNFNAWHDAKREDGKFVGSYVATSGVNVAQMVQTNAHMQTWSLHKTTDDSWNEPFFLKDYLDEGYPKYTPEYFLTHKMPAKWNGENGIFVDAALTKSNVTEKSKNSGIAWQMRGKGLGTVSYTEKDVPSGLDTVSFKARLAQSIGFDDFSVWDADGSTTAKNYTFVVPAVLSAANGNDCSPGATMSVVACYRFRKGCYEFRIERVGSDGMMFYIYKWSATTGGDEVTAECLASQWFANVNFIQNSTTPNMYAMFISVGEEVKGETTIIAGLSCDPAKPNTSFSSTGTTQVKYRALCCVDNSTTRFTSGAFGVLCSNCNGIFADPRHYTANLQKSTIAWKLPVDPVTSAYKGYVTDAPVTYGGTQIDDRRLLEPDQATWAYTPGRTEYFEINYESTYMAKSVRAPQNLQQTVGVYLRPAAGGSWSLYESKTVSKYGFDSEPFKVTIRTNEDCQVMLKTGTKATEVTVWDIQQTGWSGEDIPNITGLARDFIYTQARIVEEVTSDKTKTNRHAVLQPARVKSGMPLSIRSPLLKGLGMVGFTYKDVKPGAEVWVQIATNNVSSRLNGTGGYNYSIESMDPGGDEPVGVWVTLRKYTYEELAAAPAQKHYIGLHDRLDVPLEGAIRIFVPSAVVDAATGKAKTDPDWGSITITDIYVEDEPAIDSKSWMGWNLRMVGDPTDSERRMYLPDMTVTSDGGEFGGGLSTALNNSMKQDVWGDPSEFDKMDPTIQSPTFGHYVTPVSSGQATIGQVRFRARLYEGSSSARVTLYGVANGAEVDWGKPLTNFTVRSSRYEIFEYKAPSEKNFAAIRLAVDGVLQQRFGVQRVLLDEVVVSEKNDTAVGFFYARPFRSGLDNDIVVENILDKDQQPLSDESWGVQAKLKFDTFGNDVDYDKGFRVTFRYFVGETPWGYENWKNETQASPEVELVQVGSKSDYIYRSTAADRDTVVPPNASGTVVQYVVKVYYYEKGNDTEYSRFIAVTETDGDGWTNPAWYWPIDKNRLENGSWKAAPVPYTILESISPGRAWINEVNYNDGSKALNGNADCVTNQFIELAVPWGVDLTDWKLVLTDKNHYSVTMAVLGRNSVPSKKQTDDGRRSGDYDFLVLQSPATRSAGGIRDHVTGAPAADGTWTGETLSSTLSGGTLSYANPYQLELIRPSGIVEHQFVIAGTNEYALPNPYYELFGYQYDGTNLVKELDAEMPSVKRFYDGDDLARRPSDASAFASFGVTGGAHGEKGGWTPDMRFTPGRLNEGQDELINWYIRPSGGSCWVYVRIDKASTHLTQRIGEDTSSDTFVLVNSGNSTSVTYTAANWYQLDRVHRIENGVTNTVRVGAKGTYEFPVNTVTGLTTIVATEAISSELIDAGLDPLDRHTPAVMRWLERGLADGKPFKHSEGPVRTATYRGLEAGATNCVIGLKGMYWFDIDPTEGGWWLRGGYSDVTTVQRKWYQSDGSFTPYGNVQLWAKLYFSNDTDRVEAEVFAPKRLQGPNNERSDDLASYNNWTGVTFQVIGNLINGEEHNVGYLPFRWFVFGPDSFGPKGSAHEYETHIEVMDPFSTASPGYAYGWPDYKGSAFGFKWRISEKLMPIAVEMLEADSTYDGKVPFVPPAK